MMDSATPDEDVLRAEWRVGWTKMNLRTLSFVRFINFQKNSDFSTNSNADSVILREAKLSRRIYWITNYKFFAKWNGIAESNCHTAWNEMESQNLLKNRWWILQLRTEKSSVQNDTLDGPQWIQGP